MCDWEKYPSVDLLVQLDLLKIWEKCIQSPKNGTWKGVIFAVFLFFFLTGNVSNNKPKKMCLVNLQLL